MNIQIIKPQQQAKGEFDGGKITEQKPIGFSGEGSAINRLGPLFYWAWGKAPDGGGIGAHPHSGFEIMSYIISGKGFHKDSLGTESVVGSGGIQLMQTGSGMWHSEGSDGPAEIFQIWLEPHLNEAIKRTPKYTKYTNDDFPVSSINGVTVKTILGTDSPIQLYTDAKMFDVEITKGSVYKHTLESNRTLSWLSFRGDGGIVREQAANFSHKDFVIIQSHEHAEVTIEANSQDLRIFIIEVPSEVDYPLYHKPQ